MTADEPSVQSDPRARRSWMISDALRRYGSDSTRLSHVFSGRNHLQPVDLQALVAILNAERGDRPLTPGSLRAHLQLSSAGTSYVIDRLEQAGHVRRSRETPTDNRIVHLRYTDQGLATAQDFFGPLGVATEHVLDQFDEQQLAVIERFVTAAADALHDFVQNLANTA